MNCSKRSALMSMVAVSILAGCSSLEPTNPQDPGRVSEGSLPTSADASREKAIASLFQTPAGGSPWRPFQLPSKRFASFQFETDGGVPALTVQSDRSVSILRRQFPQGLASPDKLDFSWKADALPQGADLSESSGEDAAVRVLLSFDGDHGRWSSRNHRLSELSRLLTGEPMPYATLMYVWSNQGDVGSIMIHPRTDRIRKLVLDSGASHLGQWRHHRRDIRSDFVEAFGEEPGPLIAIAVMTDTDNTRSRLKAWYGPLHLSSR